MCDCDELKEIKKLIMIIHDLQVDEFHMKHDTKYKCENYDTYTDNYEKIKTKLFVTRMIFIEKCNDFIDYPTKKFLCFDLTKKIKFKHETFIGLKLEIPFIDKQEYFCLINLFENMIDYMDKWDRHDPVSFMFK